MPRTEGLKTAHSPNSVEEEGLGDGDEWGHFERVLGC